MKNLINQNKGLVFIIKFLVLFGLFYGLCLAVIGLAAPGGLYIPFVEKHLDFISLIKTSIGETSAFILRQLGYSGHVDPGFKLHIHQGAGVIIAQDCVGFGVYSFWLAYVIASYSGNWKKTFFWAVVGVVILWAFNILRIVLLILALQKKEEPFGGMNHHTFFNIVAYGFIFIMIWLFEKNFFKTKKAIVSNQVEVI